MNKFIFTALFGSFLCASINQDIAVHFGYSKLSSFKNNGKTNIAILEDEDHTKKDSGKFMYGASYCIGTPINDTFSLKANIFANFNDTKREYADADSYSQYKIKDSIGIMPVAEFKIHDNVTIFAGAGIASTKVEETHGALDPSTTDDNYKTSKRKSGFAYNIGFDVIPDTNFSIGVTYQLIKTKINFIEDLDPNNATDNITKTKANANVANVMLVFKYKF